MDQGLLRVLGLKYAKKTPCDTDFPKKSYIPPYLYSQKVPSVLSSGPDGVGKISNQFMIFFLGVWLAFRGANVFF